MVLLDVYLLWSPDSDGAEERFDLFEAACSIGEAAFASEHQLFVLTEASFENALARLTSARSENDFLKVQEVAGRFVLTGSYPDAVHDLIERAGQVGAVSLDWSNRPEQNSAAATARGAPVWLH